MSGQQKHIRPIKLTWTRGELYLKGDAVGALAAAAASSSPWNPMIDSDSIKIQDIKIREQLQALIAPALLPMLFLSLQILQFLRTFTAQVPVTNPGTGRRSVGGLYYL
ncbi:V-type proton ATPase catalytic subunit A-like [Hibiscus syriacus]|uniref:V-type proton ATPase catalytic subunit A-like n=1 Tax=Hibiscus syriacus TaxID=106335 RepID=A0A6A2YQQ3_HIBSY|nr:V-type proton ATPase catalytic subunit A-like [Hibiscus syriacus]